MKRKIVKQGAATLMISLPSKWARHQGLDKGDEIEIEESGDTILIKREKGEKKEYKVSMDITGYTPLVNRVLMAYYIKGVDELEVKFSNPEEIKDFQKRVINELIGFEILKQSHNSMIIKDITDENQDVDQIINRIFFIIDSMAEELVIAIEKKESLDPIIEIDASVNKFVNFCLRIINKKGYSEPMKTHLIYPIVTILEEIGDSYKNIAKEAQKSKMDKEQIEVLKGTRESIKMIRELLSKFDKEKVIAFAKQYEKIKEKIKTKNKFDYLLTQLNETIIQINNYLMVMKL